MDFDQIVCSDDKSIYNLETNAPGPAGALPVTEKILEEWPSGHIFGMTEDAGMGWPPSELSGKQFLILGNLGGIRAPDSAPDRAGLLRQDAHQFHHGSEYRAGVLRRCGERCDRPGIRSARRLEGLAGQ